MRARSEDVCCRLLQESEIETVAGFFASVFVSRFEEIDAARERIASERKGAMVAIRNDIVLGAIFFELGQEDNRKMLYLERVVVASQYRRQGVCSMMISWTLKYARQFGYEYAGLIVNGTNAGAIRCYEKNGFTIRDSRKHRVVDYDPIIIRMERDVWR